MKNVLLVQTSFLGDVVLTTPVFVELRRRFPEMKRTVLTTPRAAAILDGHPAVDRVLTDDKRKADRGIGGVFRVAARLRRERFDVVLSVHRSFRTALVLRLAGIPRRVGFRESRGWFLFTETVPRDAGRHDVERNLCILRAFGIEPEACERRLALGITPRAAARAESLLTEGASGGGPLIGLAPGSVWATKRWRPAGFARVARSLVHEKGARVVLLGGPEDQGIAREIERAAGTGVRNLVGRTDLATLVAVVSRLDLLITNDSAPLHVGSAVGVPRVAIFCATSPAQGFGPWGGRSRVIDRDLECRPCGRHGAATCPRGTEDCIELVRDRDVLDAAGDLLAGG